VKDSRFEAVLCLPLPLLYSPPLPVIALLLANAMELKSVEGLALSVDIEFLPMLLLFVLTGLDLGAADVAGRGGNMEDVVGGTDMAGKAERGGRGESGGNL
jgi:hypothetical protein